MIMMNTMCCLEHHPRVASTTTTAAFTRDAASVVSPTSVSRYIFRDDGRVLLGQKRRHFRSNKPKRHHHHQNSWSSWSSFCDVTVSSMAIGEEALTMTTTRHHHHHHNHHHHHYLREGGGGGGCGRQKTTHAMDRRKPGVRKRSTRTALATTPHASAAVGVNELAWALSTLYALFCFSICVRAKRGDAKSIERIRNYSTLVPLAIFYGVLLIRSWSDDTLRLMMPGSLEEGLRTGEVQFIPKLSGISELLSEKAASASAWAHFMLVNLFVARHATLQSLTFDLPVAHTLALCLITGPLGLLSHVLTKWIALKLRRHNTAAQ